MRRAAVAVTVLIGALAASGARAEGDSARGAQVYRVCVACHALEPDLHLTGPSLAGLWMRPAGQVEDFARYSDPLRNAGFPWNAAALDAWLTDPAAMIPGTSMTFRGIADASARADLIAFLEQAGQPGGAERLIEAGVIPAVYLRGQAPEPVRDAPAHARVVAMRHCSDGYTIETEDGALASTGKKMSG